MSASTDTILELVSSPFQEAFSNFYGAATSRCFICSPFITQPPVKAFLEHARRRGVLEHLHLHVLTDISASNIIQGATDLGALTLLMEALPTVRMQYLPRLHAKAYLADSRFALIGSANFTDGGIFRNHEYGVRLHEEATIERIWADMFRYSDLGASLTLENLRSLQEQVEQVRAATLQEQSALRAQTRRVAEHLQSEILSRQVENHLVELRVTGRTIHSLFCETLLYLLAQRDMTAEEMAEWVQNMHPDLCDTEDRIIHGQSFGKKWKHHLRTARGTLQRKGLIRYRAKTAQWTAQVSK